ncbi:2-keto-4-pentenoate hydratase [Corticibacter populi]|uniref:2-keto-4-pentenoate hydratase n=1 Tax=Corticibacter populi TaxID=1550736 RepID=A0A3M6QTL8_9BURK|nr:fumarylacetoacetate hydrolase family protein [Corticibacter populi]RMX06374.1 2-keto-4-pentenoate hydratase [Corticibacter populi]RZS32080.1 2-keto-4-pentenoate hydratase [Corticibacter populi]
MTAQVEQMVQLLCAAREQGRQADASGLELTLQGADDAYAVQDAVAQRLAWWQKDAAPMHWKAGGPGRAAALVHAPLPPGGVWPSPADARHWPAHVHGIEAEIALRLGQAVTPAQAQHLDHAQATELVDAMAVAIELVDFRWQQQAGANEWLKLADLQSHGALVLGPWVPFEARDWQAQVCRVRIGSQPLIERQGTHSLQDPAWLLPQWLVHATQRFGTLAAGTVVTTGTWIGMPWAQPGDLVEASFDGIGSALVQL